MKQRNGLYKSTPYTVLFAYGTLLFTAGSIIASVAVLIGATGMIAGWGAGVGWLIVGSVSQVIFLILWLCLIGYVVFKS